MRSRIVTTWFPAVTVECRAGQAGGGQSIFMYILLPITGIVIVGQLKF